MSVFHEDIKPENFVLMKFALLTLAFQYNIFENDDMNLGVTSLASGTTTFNSLELLIKVSDSFSADIWSFGTTFYIISLMVNQ